ncbi:aldehyde dehydrogenase family protein [Arthrobacter sp. 35W]|uniref:aldehyde dehydrogenase family protein n=1 Tax=Arthrobacter sp. 35W TaxID=1132441 RepID=UPI00040DCD97|nr:aldehyde dehydrogenase family protein [Arthrobacter sp. 35W]
MIAQMETMAQTVARARAVFNSGVSRPVAWRREQLHALNRMLVERQGEIAAALEADLGKHASESWLTEIGFLTAEIAHTLKHLKRWLAPEASAVPVALAPAAAKIVLEPLGVVLVIGPWNYPIQLLLAPVIGALAAGNTVVAKPSELAPASSAVLARLVPEYLPDAVRIVQGGVAETTELLEQRFDHIFYTGNGRVGRIVMAAAAKHLTPVTLELGGKSPTYVDDTTDLEVAAARIAWGKFMNAGQTCVAPDYVLGTAEVLDRLAALLPAAIERFYGVDPKSSGEYGRIIHEGAFARLTALLEDDDVELVTGGAADAAQKYLAPTVVRAGADSKVMQEEIFGPILPLVAVDGLEDAIGFITARDKPLALYVFSEDAAVRQAFTERTSSGALAFGVPAAHLLVPGLPFGGVGESGMGRYHGRHSLRTFSHPKAVLDKPMKPDTMVLVYPPFGALRNQIIRRLVAPAARIRRRGKA